MPIIFMSGIWASMRFASSTYILLIAASTGCIIQLENSSSIHDSTASSNNATGIAVYAYPAPQYAPKQKITEVTIIVINNRHARLVITKGFLYFLRASITNLNMMTAKAISATMNVWTNATASNMMKSIIRLMRTESLLLRHQRR